MRTFSRRWCRRRGCGHNSKMHRFGLGWCRGVNSDGDWISADRPCGCERFARKVQEGDST